MAERHEDATHRREVRRDSEQVTPLELFFDLVFVVSITQCTTVMENRLSWLGVGQAMILLGLLWWAWVGYAWLTSVVDPEEDAVRLVIFVAIAAFLVAALAVPEAFGNEATTFVVAYAVLRAAHLGLAVLASRAEPELRRSLTGLAASTAVGLGLLIGGVFVTGSAWEVVWLVAVLFDAGASLFFGASGWQFVARHFAERHGLIIIIALGESIIAIGVGAGVDLTGELIIAAVLGVFLAAALWWAYFDVASIAAARRVASLPPGKERNEMARDSYSYLHFPMVAGVVLTAFAIHNVLRHVHDPLHFLPACALGGGVGVYLLAHVAFTRRALGIMNAARLVTAILLVVLIPVWQTVDALLALGGVLAIMVTLISYETIWHAESRADQRRFAHQT